MTKRYTWRHDSVLANIEPFLRKLLDRWNALPMNAGNVPHISKSFVAEGEEIKTNALPTRQTSLLDGARDWNCLVDYDHCRIVFPPEICGTSERPDIVIWSLVFRTVILIELTCPAEEGIEPAEIRKRARYKPLCAQIQSSKPPWTPILITIEVGARGFVAHSLRRCFKRLGMERREINALCKQLSEVAARCSYAIFLARTSKEWRQSALITIQ